VLPQLSAKTIDPKRIVLLIPGSIAEKFDYPCPNPLDKVIVSKVALEPVQN
jgi:hypothetical protein